MVEDEIGTLDMEVMHSMFKLYLFAVVRLEEEVVTFFLLILFLFIVDDKVVVVRETTAANLVNNYVCFALFVLKLTCNTRLPNV